VTRSQGIPGCLGHRDALTCGDAARAWAEQAEAQGAEAWYALAHFPTPAETVMDHQARTLMVTMPDDVLVTAVAAEEFADDVDRERQEYAATPRKRKGSNGEPVGGAQE